MDEPVEKTYPCEICGRKFIKSSLEKHTAACKKLASLHRKPFDSGKQRAKGSDITYADVKKAQSEKAKNGGVFPRPQTNWKERHGHFIDAVSSSKRVDYALKTGAPLPPPPKTAVPSDYVQCEYCGRNFNAQAAERHVPFCREQNARKQTSVKTPSASRSIAGNYRNLPTKQEVSRNSHESSRRDGSVERHSSTRGRDGSVPRSRNESANEMTTRRKSLETRSNLSSSHVSSRNTSLSAGQRQGNLPPATPSKRSTSATRSSSQHRLKTPVTPTRSSSRSRAREESASGETRLSQARMNSRNSSKSRLF